LVLVNVWVQEFLPVFPVGFDKGFLDQGPGVATAFKVFGQYESMFLKVLQFCADASDSEELAVWDSVCADEYRR
jgi:hypothetical protein